jgi:hypothetical protein
MAGALVFAVFYLYLASTSRARCSLRENPTTVYGFVALVAFIAFMSLPSSASAATPTARRGSTGRWPRSPPASRSTARVLPDVFVGRVGSPIGQDYMMGVLPSSW